MTTTATYHQERETVVTFGHLVAYREQIRGEHQYLVDQLAARLEHERAERVREDYRNGRFTLRVSALLTVAATVVMVLCIIGHVSAYAVAGLPAIPSIVATVVTYLHDEGDLD